MNDLTGPMNLDKAAEYLSISKGTLYNLVNKRKISFHKPNGKLLYFRREDLDAFAFRDRKIADFEACQKVEGILNKRQGGKQ